MAQSNKCFYHNVQHCVYGKVINLITTPGLMPWATGPSVEAINAFLCTQSRWVGLQAAQEYKQRTWDAIDTSPRLCCATTPSTLTDHLEASVVLDDNIAVWVASVIMAWKWIAGWQSTRWSLSCSTLLASRSELLLLLPEWLHLDGSITAFSVLQYISVLSGWLLINHLASSMV